jgi:deazaflavin-dependent oxidoreductase (nitroreductase family)
MSDLKDATTRFWTGVHRTIFKASEGRLLGHFFGMPVVMLTTTGRKTGRKRTTMLTSPYQDGDSVVLVASYGGDDRHPKWFLNLRDNPDVEITMLGRTRPMRARLATPQEKADIWPKVTASYSGYGGYQKRTRREIPLVILEPA